MAPDFSRIEHAAARALQEVRHRDIHGVAAVERITQALLATSEPLESIRSALVGARLLCASEAASARSPGEAQREVSLLFHWIEQDMRHVFGDRFELSQPGLATPGAIGALGISPERASPNRRVPMAGAAAWIWRAVREGRYEGIQSLRAALDDELGLPEALTGLDLLHLERGALVLLALGPVMTSVVRQHCDNPADFDAVMLWSRVPESMRHELDVTLALFDHSMATSWGRLDGLLVPWPRGARVERPDEVRSRLTPFQRTICYAGAAFRAEATQWMLRAHGPEGDPHWSQVVRHLERNVETLNEARIGHALPRYIHSLSPLTAVELLCAGSNTGLGFFDRVDRTLEGAGEPPDSRMRGLVASYTELLGFASLSTEGLEQATRDGLLDADGALSPDARFPPEKVRVVHRGEAPAIAFTRRTALDVYRVEDPKWVRIGCPMAARFEAAYRDNPPPDFALSETGILAYVTWFAERLGYAQRSSNL